MRRPRALGRLTSAARDRRLLRLCCSVEVRAVPRPRIAWNMPHFFENTALFRERGPLSRTPMCDAPRPCCFRPFHQANASSHSVNEEKHRSAGWKYDVFADCFRSWHTSSPITSRRSTSRSHPLPTGSHPRRSHDPTRRSLALPSKAGVDEHVPLHHLAAQNLSCLARRPQRHLPGTRCRPRSLAFLRCDMNAVFEISSVGSCWACTCEGSQRQCR